ncbi:MAG: Na(+)/H(+) antiporter subunit B [Planctomycetes bacterium]|nr:Na(+)/H(+) antiporter subunit B [Planctomycetota bacterium]
MREKLILRVAAKSLLPFFFLFALYVQFHGDFGPGGGFQAGVIFAAGIVLYGLIYGIEAAQAVIPRIWVEIGVAVGVLIWGGTGIWTMQSGGRYLEYGKLDPEHFVHGQHLGIMFVELGVLCTVASGMTLIFYLFAGRGR